MLERELTERAGVLLGGLVTTFDSLAERILDRTGGAPPALSAAACGRSTCAASPGRAAPRGARRLGALRPGSPPRSAGSSTSAPRRASSPSGSSATLDAVGAPSPRARAVAALYRLVRARRAERGTLDRAARVAEAAARVAEPARRLGRPAAARVRLRGAAHGPVRARRGGRRPRRGHGRAARTSRARAAFARLRLHVRAAVGPRRRSSSSCRPRGYVERDSLIALERGLFAARPARAARRCPTAACGLLEVAGCRRARPRPSPPRRRARCAPERAPDDAADRGAVGRGCARRARRGASPRSTCPTRSTRAAAARRRPPIGHAVVAVPLRVAPRRPRRRSSPGSARRPRGSPAARVDYWDGRVRGHGRREPRRASTSTCGSRARARSPPSSSCARPTIPARGAARAARARRRLRLRPRRAHRAAHARRRSGSTPGGPPRELRRARRAARARRRPPSSCTRSRRRSCGSATTARPAACGSSGCAARAPTGSEVVVLPGSRRGRLPRPGPPRRAARRRGAPRRCSAAASRSSAATPRPATATCCTRRSRARAARRVVLLRRGRRGRRPARGLAVLGRGPRGARRRRARPSSAAGCPSSPTRSTTRRPSASGCARWWPWRRRRRCWPSGGSPRPTARPGRGACSAPAARFSRATRLVDPELARRAHGPRATSPRPSSRRSSTAPSSGSCSACSTRTTSTAGRRRPAGTAVPRGAASASSPGSRRRSARTPSRPTTCRAGEALLDAG